MRTVRRLRLRCLLFTTLCVVLSTLLLIALSKPSHPHHKRTNANTIKTTTTPIPKPVKSSMLVPLWWRWRESNPRPEHLSHCFIQQFLHYTLYLSHKANLFLYSSLNFLNPAIQLSRFSINNLGKSLSTPMIIIRLPTGIPVRSSNATAYAAVCIK